MFFGIHISYCSIAFFGICCYRRLWIDGGVKKILFYTIWLVMFVVKGRLLVAVKIWQRRPLH
jgi:hypothetical protein